MTPLIVRYPLDPTGTSTNNLVSGEIQNLTPNRNVRAIATLYGAFFTESLVVTDTSNNKVLTPGTQYYAAEMYELPTARYGKEICAVILITDATVSNQVSLTYQALGGPYGTSATAIISQIENLQLDTRPVAWGDILDRPSEFPPAFHLHDIGDVYGFEYLVHAIDRVRDAIEVGDTYQFDQIYSYIDHVNSVLEGEIDSNFTAFQAHLSDYTNPHRTTAAQVGAYTTAQSDANLTAATTPINNALLAHESNYQNPHQVTAAQVGAYTIAQTTSAINTAQAAVQANLTAHTTNYQNPHQTTAAQVGAYTTAQVDAKLAALQAALTPATAFVQQGTGVGQAANVVKVGWSTGGLRVTVDATDLGYFPRSTTPDGTFTYNGSIWATGNVGSLSDRRLKKDIQRIDNALDRLELIEGATWLADDPRYHADSARRAGVIAQGVFNALSEATTRDDDGYLGVVGLGVTGILVEAVKELRQEFKQLHHAVVGG